MTVHKDMYIYGDSLIVLHSFFKCTVHFADSRRSELTVLNYILCLAGYTILQVLEQYSTIGIAK